MFDMAGVSSTTTTLLNSPALIKMSTSSPCPSSTMSPNQTTPNHHQLLHSLSGHHVVKKEMGLMSSPGSDENLHCNLTSSGPADAFNSKCKRKINFSHLGIPPRGHQPATVARRNARERNRVKQVNNGFAALKQHIPLGHRSKKMSKVETLRCAVDYIKNLKTLLDPNDVGAMSDDSPFEAHQHYQFDFGVSSGSGSMQQLSPTSSDDPSSPSYASEGSYIACNGAPTALYDYENYEPVSPENEALLDVISFWQQT